MICVRIYFIMLINRCIFYVNYQSICSDCDLSDFEKNKLILLINHIFRLEAWTKKVSLKIDSKIRGLICGNRARWLFHRRSRKSRIIWRPDKPRLLWNQLWFLPGCLGGFYSFSFIMYLYKACLRPVTRYQMSWRPVTCESLADEWLACPPDGAVCVFSGLWFVPSGTRYGYVSSLSSNRRFCHFFKLKVTHCTFRLMNTK